MSGFDAVPAALAASWPVAVAAGALTVLFTRRVLEWLLRRQILDLPNDRSSHSRPTPRGGGLALAPVMAVLLLALAWQGPLFPALLGLGALALLAVSWWDDRHSLPPLPRFGAHMVVVAATLALLPPSLLVFQGWLPLPVDRLLAGLGWLWFVNLYNFMDGIDGITGCETVSLGLGIALIGAVSGLGDIAPHALLTAAAAAGFLLFNWHPARLFMGDSGSIPLGFVLGGLLIFLAAHGQLAAALILPAYYLTDATLTIGKRAWRRERIWQAHRQHFYQRAVQGGKRHDQVVWAIAIVNAGLVAAALAAAQGFTALAVTAALVMVALLLGRMQSWSKGGRT